MLSVANLDSVSRLRSLLSKTLTHYRRTRSNAAFKLGVVGESAAPRAEGVWELDLKPLCFGRKRYYCCTPTRSAASPKIQCGVNGVGSDNDVRHRRSPGSGDVDVLPVCVQVFANIVKSALFPPLIKPNDIAYTYRMYVL